MADGHLELGNNLRFTFESVAASGADNPFSVVSMQGQEALGRPFRFELVLMADVAKVIAFDKMLSDAATLEILVPGASSRAPVPYHGVLEEFDELQKTATTAFYRAVLVPRFARAMTDRVSQVYLTPQAISATLTDVLKKTFLSGGAKDLEFDLLEKYDARESVWQYQESTFNFVSRWLEKEGMYYYFDHSDGVEKMVVVDGAIKLPDSVTSVFYRPAGSSETGSADQAVQQFICRRSRLPKQVVLQDFNYRTANVPVKVTSTIPGGVDSSGDVMIYGEDVRNATQGTRYAKMRAQEIGCGGVLYFGTSTAVGLRSGYFMKMDKNPLLKADQKFLVTEIEHRGSQASMLLEKLENPFADLEGEIFYSNTFTAILGATEFRPARTTPRPNIAGSMSANVVAEGGGNYADLDDKGQYKVKLPFAVDQNAATARIRMATPYSGSDHGMDFPLHKDAEVLLSFINGDPDQPVIMNAAPNSMNPSVVDNTKPQISLIKTAGGNSITLNDEKGKEFIEMKAPNGSGTITVGSVAGNAYFSKGNTYGITIGASNKISVGANNTVSASTDTGFSMSAASKFSIGTSLGYTMGRDVKWTSTSSRSTAIGDGVTYAFKETAITKAGTAIIMNAGYTDSIDNQAKIAALSAKKTALRKYIAMVTALNIGIGAAGAYYTGKDKSVKSGKDDLTADDNIIALAGQASVAAISTAAFVHLVNNTIANLVAELDKLECVSWMYMNNTGIEQKWEKALQSRISKMTDKGIWHIAREKNLVPGMGNKFYSQLSLEGDTGARLYVEGSKVGAAAPSSELKLRPDGKAALSSTTDIKLGAPKIEVTTGAGFLKISDTGDIKLEGRTLDLGFLATGTAAGLKIAAQIAAVDGEIVNAGLATAAAVTLQTQHIDAVGPDASVEEITAGFRLLGPDQIRVTTCRAEEAALQAKRATLVAAQAVQDALPAPSLHGLLVASDAVKMKYSAAEVKVSPASVDIVFGPSTIKVGPATIEHSAPLIKLG